MHKFDPTVSMDDLSNPERAILQVGGRHTSQMMFYTIWDMDDFEVESDVWNRQIPDSMKTVEGEYYALLRGLQTVLEVGYSEVKILTSAAPIAVHLEINNEPSSELEPYHEAVEIQLERFEEVEYRPYTSI